jgi:hypothetical protein
VRAVAGTLKRTSLDGQSDAGLTRSVPEPSCAHATLRSLHVHQASDRRSYAMFTLLHAHEPLTLVWHTRATATPAVGRRAGGRGYRETRPESDSPPDLGSRGPRRHQCAALGAVIHNVPELRTPHLCRQPGRPRRPGWRRHPRRRWSTPTSFGGLHLAGGGECEDDRPRRAGGSRTRPMRTLDYREHHPLTSGFLVHDRSVFERVDWNVG